MYYYVIHNEAKYFIGFRTLMIPRIFPSLKTFDARRNIATGFSHT